MWTQGDTWVNISEGFVLKEDAGNEMRERSWAVSIEKFCKMVKFKSGYSDSGHRPC